MPHDPEALANEFLETAHFIGEDTVAIWKMHADFERDTGIETNEYQATMRERIISIFDGKRLKPTDILALIRTDPDLAYTAEHLSTVRVRDIQIEVIDSLRKTFLQRKGITDENDEETFDAIQRIVDDKLGFGF